MKLKSGYVSFGRDVDFYLGKTKGEQKRYTVYANLEAVGHIDHTVVTAIKNMVAVIDSMREEHVVASDVAYKDGALTILVQGFDIRTEKNYKIAKEMIQGVLSILRTA